MKKIARRLIAMVTAFVLTSATAISANAASYGLYYTIGAPQSSVRLKQNFNSTVTRKQEYTISNSLTSFGGEELTSYGFVMCGNLYYCVAKVTQNSTGTKTSTGTYYRVSAGATAKNEVRLDKGTNNVARAYGTVVGY